MTNEHPGDLGEPAEAGLALAEALAFLPHTRNLAVLSLDDDGIIRWAAGSESGQVLGRSADQVLDRHLRDLVPDGAEAIDHALHRALDERSPQRCVAARSDGQGSKVAISITLDPLTRTSGELGGVYAIVHDVPIGDAARPGGPNRLVLATASFDQAPIPQAMLDVKGRFLCLNRAWCELFDYPETHLVGQDLRELVASRRQVSDLAEVVHDVLSGKAGSVSRELIGQRSDGRHLWLMLDVALVRDAVGRPAAVTVFARDVTEVQQARLRLAAQERMFFALSRRSADSAIVMDADLNIVYVSPSVTDVFGYEQVTLLLVSTQDLVHPADADVVEAHIHATVQQPEHTERFTARLRDAQNEWRWVECTMTNCLTDRDIGGLVVNLRDITPRIEAEAALRESEARYRAIVETALEGILVTSPDGGTVFANEVMAQILGLPLTEVYEKAPDLLHEGSTLAPTGLAGPERAEVVYERPDGDERILVVASSPLDTEDGRFGTLRMVSDVTGERRSEAELRHKALHDPLTDLPNRYLLQDRLAMAAARCERAPGLRMAVLFLDLDRFKTVNDVHGHGVGDKLLQEVAARLVRSTRPADTVARLGGDEFAIVCEASGPDATSVAERIHLTLGRPLEVDGTSFDVSTSIGVALSPPWDPAELLRRADVAMYQAKAAGGAVTVVYS